MGFERFVRVGRNYRPRVSITAAGLIGFNVGFVKKFPLKEYAVLYFDRVSRYIGIELADNPNSGDAIQIRKRTSGADISAKSFFDFYDIDYHKTKQFLAVWNEYEQKIVVKLGN